MAYQIASTALLIASTLSVPSEECNFYVERYPQPPFKEMVVHPLGVCTGTRYSHSQIKAESVMYRCSRDKSHVIQYKYTDSAQCTGEYLAYTATRNPGDFACDYAQTCPYIMTKVHNEETEGDDLRNWYSSSWVMNACSNGQLFSCSDNSAYTLHVFDNEECDGEPLSSTEYSANEPFGDGLNFYELFCNEADGDNQPQKLPDNAMSVDIAEQDILEKEEDISEIIDNAEGDEENDEEYADEIEDGGEAEDEDEQEEELEDMENNQEDDGEEEETVNEVENAESDENESENIEDAEGETDEEDLDATDENEEQQTGEDDADATDEDDAGTQIDEDNDEEEDMQNADDEGLDETEQPNEDENEEELDENEDDEETAVTDAEGEEEDIEPEVVIDAYIESAICLHGRTEGQHQEIGDEMVAYCFSEYDSTFSKPVYKGEFGEIRWTQSAGSYGGSYGLFLYDSGEDCMSTLHSHLAYIIMCIVS